MSWWNLMKKVSLKNLEKRVSNNTFRKKLCTSSLCIRGKLAKNLTKFPLLARPRFWLSYPEYKPIETVARWEVSLKLRSSKTPPTSKNRRLGAWILRRVKPSKFINVNRSSKEQLEIRCSNASCSMVMCWRSRLFKHLKPRNVPGGFKRQLNSSKCTSFWKRYIAEGSLYRWPFQISSINSLIEPLERNRIHLSISRTFWRSRWESLNLFMGPIWSNKTWSTMLTILLFIRLWSWAETERPSVSNIRLGRVTHLYLHLLDKTLVLTASLSDRCDNILSMICAGKLLILSRSTSILEGSLQGSLCFCIAIYKHIHRDLDSCVYMRLRETLQLSNQKR